MSNLFPAFPRAPFPPACCAQIVLRWIDPCLLLKSRALNQPKKYTSASPAAPVTTAAIRQRPRRTFVQRHSSTTPACRLGTQVASGDYLGAAKTYEELVRVWFFVWKLKKRKKNKGIKRKKRNMTGLLLLLSPSPSLARPLARYLILALSISLSPTKLPLHGHHHHFINRSTSPSRPAPSTRSASSSGARPRPSTRPPPPRRSPCPCPRRPPGPCARC